MLLCGNVMAFAACYFEIEAQYSDLSGLTVVAQVGRSQEFPVSLNFEYPESYLFSSALNRFSFQPTFNLGPSVAPVNEPLANRHSWRGQILRTDLKLGDEIFSEHTFGLVESQPRMHVDYHDVGGIIALTQASPRAAPSLMRDRILRLECVSRCDAVRITSLGARKLLNPWTYPVVSIPAFPTQRSRFYTTENSWSFSASASFGRTRLHNDIHIQVDPSSQDMLLPASMIASITGSGSGDFAVSIDSKRLFVAATSGAELSFEFRCSRGRIIRLSAESIKFYRDYSQAMPGYEGLMVPLRIRFVSGVGYIKLGRSLLESYKRVYMDNITFRIHLVPRGVIFGRPQTQNVVPARPAFTVRDVFDDLSIDPSSLEIALPLSDSLDQGLVPWSFRQRELVGYELKLIRRFKKDLTYRESTSFLTLSVNAAIVQCVGDMSSGLSLRFIETEQDRSRYTSIEIFRSSTEVRITSRRMRIQVQLPPPYLATAPDETSCGICKEPINTDETIQIIPPCNHKFHADCIFPWLHMRKVTCPVCRSFIPGTLSLV